MTTHNTPRIYVACLASYNNGTLHGEWIDCTDIDIVQEAIADMLADSPQPGVEEWAIHDYEGFGAIAVSEHEDLAKLAEVGALIEDWGEAFAAYADNVGVEHADKAGFEEAFCGEWKDEEEYAYHIMEECYEVPEHLEFYIDYEKFARDLFMSDNYSINSPGGVFVFRNC